MKHIFLNPKRLDIPREYGGVDGVAPMEEWGGCVVQNTQERLKVYSAEDVEFVMYFPEAHLVPAVRTLCEDSPTKIGCQGVYRDDTTENGNFDALTTNRTTSAAKAMGYSSVIIGHCKKRKGKAGILEETGVTDEDAIGRLLNQKIEATIRTGLIILYCIGETADGQEHRQEVLKSQLETGLKDVGKEKVVIAYEPVWAIGPGKTPPDETYITRIGTYIKGTTGGMDVVYGGGLKTDNARMLAPVPVMDGGLITLTRFQGQIGFYPKEYLETVRIYLERDRILRTQLKVMRGLSYEIII